MKNVSSLSILMLVLFGLHAAAQHQTQHQTKTSKIDLQDFLDSSHHWYDITDDNKVITPLPNQQKYKPTEIARIADNILLYQKSNGGWPKNYDMLAHLTDTQRAAVQHSKNETNTTFDNGATHSHVEYLAKAYSITKDERYKDACVRGLDFIVSAQYANGGWPQFYPDTNGYRKYITFNDGAMIGVMNVLNRIVQHSPQYAFVDSIRTEKIRTSFAKGIDCILKCQILQNDKPTVWCQQHDNVDFRPRGARTFELPSLCGQESAEIVLFLMSVDQPDERIVTAVRNAVAWFETSKLVGIKVETIQAPAANFKYHKTSIDRIVVNDPKAPPLWARFYALEANMPLFCNRDGKPVSTMAEVERERRTGYAWYSDAPQQVLENFPRWQKKWQLRSTGLEK